MRNGKSGLPAWKRSELFPKTLPQYVDAEVAPHGYVAWERIGEGKDRQLDYARSTAVWLDASDEDLTAPGLKERLESRLPALLLEFRQAVEFLGFTF